MPEKDEKKTDPAPPPFDFGAWVSQDPKNQAVATAWAERNVAAPLKEKNQQILEEKKNLAERLKSFEKTGGEGEGESPTGKGKGKYTDEDIKKLLGEKETAFEGEKKKLIDYTGKLKGELQRQLIDGQLVTHLTQAGIKPSNIGILVNHLKSPHETGKERIRIAEEEGNFKIIVQDKNGSARFGKNETFTLAELVAETREGFKDLFLAPASGGSGNQGTGIKTGNSRYKITFDDWARLDSKKQKDYKFDDVAPMDEPNKE